VKIYFNGKILPIEEARVPVLDRGLLYGDGLFESLRTYNRRPFLLEEHLKRLLAGARLLKIKLPCSLAQLKLAVLKTVASNPFREHYIKIIITRGEAKGHGLDFSNSTGKPTVIVFDEEMKEYPRNTFTRGWKAVISSVRRTEIPTSRIKSLCYLDNALAMAEARRAGANEAFMLSEKGHVVEGTVSNIFIVKLGTIYTPSVEEPILSGITRNLVLKLARQSAFRAVEKIIDPKELYNCDECFITMSGAGIIPVTRIWKKKIGNGKCGSLTQKFILLYQAETRK
jgi:branched-chain amino acid aminotransferase